jgi:beta-mannanase
MKDGLFYGVCLTWMMSYNSTSTGIEAFEYTQKVANGDYDNLIRANARWIKNNFPYKLLIRLNHEFNLGNWGWSKDAAVYAKAWRRVADDFRIEDMQAEWVWSPNFQDNPSTIHYQDYYPGDDYVDWIGVDVYANSWIHDSDGWTAEEMLSCRGTNNLSIYEFALLHNKPCMIAEWGLNITGDMTDEQNAAWLTGMFDAIEKRPDLRAIIHWGGSPWYLMNYPVAANVYRDRVSSAKYSVLYP